MDSVEKSLLDDLYSQLRPDKEEKEEVPMELDEEDLAFLLGLGEEIKKEKHPLLVELENISTAEELYAYLERVYDEIKEVFLILLSHVERELQQDI